jgi:hypothetical protein
MLSRPRNSRVILTARQCGLEPETGRRTNRPPVLSSSLDSAHGLRLSAHARWARWLDRAMPGEKAFRLPPLRAAPSRGRGKRGNRPRGARAGLRHCEGAKRPRQSTRRGGSTYRPSRCCAVSRSLAAHRSRLAVARKPEAGSRKPEAGSRKPEAGSRKPEAGSRLKNKSPFRSSRQASIPLTAYGSRLTPARCPGAATGEPEPRRRDAKSLRAVTKRRRFASREPERAEGAGRRSRAARGELRG